MPKKNKSKIDPRSAYFNTVLGQVVRGLRLSAGLSMEEVAKKSGLSAGRIERIEMALVHTTIMELETLADGMGITGFDLFKALSDKLDMKRLASLRT